VWPPYLVLISKPTFLSFDCHSFWKYVQTVATVILTAVNRRGEGYSIDQFRKSARVYVYNTFTVFTITRKILQRSGFQFCGHSRDSCPAWVCHLTRKIVPDMTYTVFGGMLNPTPLNSESPDHRFGTVSPLNSTNLISLLDSSAER